MNPFYSGSRRSSIKVAIVIGLLVGAGAGVAVVVTVDGAALSRTAQRTADEPLGVLIGLSAFGAAFILRAIAWCRVLPGLRFDHSLAGIHLALGANHVLPFRLGEPLRIFSVVRRQEIGLQAATASTVTLRAGDILAVLGLGLLIAPAAFAHLIGWFGWVLLGAVVAAAAVGWRWLLVLGRNHNDVVMPGPVALGLSTGAWLAESVLVWQSAQWAGIDASWPDALLVTTVAVAAQIAAIAPGGFGTYEAASVAAYVALGHDAEAALVAAITAHALKTAYSLAAGGIALFAPNPSLVGRLRLPSSDPPPETTADAPQSHVAPVLLFMPAFNEEASIKACIERAPAEVCGQPVEVLVVDDGSNDSTVEFAHQAGADVLELSHNQGLGAAVRAGLAAGVDRGAAAVVFCDADGEYPPEELANLVRPILDGHADYVTGSRFLGHIEHMQPHRRFGNKVLTRTLSLIARRPITDGQTGYRALSPAAAASAEIIHDFNYAQVLTLDLLAKGYRYEEVPISYHFRTAGDSYVKLGPYLRNVVPAVYRELNAS
ncbi:MAG: glycosyltransferase [Acidimicrobiales bacterium]